MTTLARIKQDQVVAAFIAKGDEHLGAMGYTEHGFRHANLVSNINRNILERLSFSDREAELGAIAGYIHDLGNAISRHNHGQTSAVLATDLLLKMGMPPLEVATVAGAIGNHEEEYGQPVNNVSAALIIADKSDVHRSRVRNNDPATFDIHDRVSYAAIRSFLNVREDKRTITLELTVEIEICPVMEYFEIFLARMMMCRRAASFLDCHFHIVINGTPIL